MMFTRTPCQLLLALPLLLPTGASPVAIHHTTLPSKTPGLKSSRSVNRLGSRLDAALSPAQGLRLRKDTAPTKVKAEPSDDLKEFQKDLEQKFVEKRIEMLEETQADKAAVSPIGSVGGTAPMGQYWDPAGFTREADPNQVKRYREAEITHGRVAMLGALGFLVQEKFAPLFGGNIDGPAIYHFQEIAKVAPNFWYPVMLAIAIAEVARARIGWEEPSGGSLFGLRPGYEPGNLGFDPLGLKPKDANNLLAMQNKELNNGRLAMLALAGFIAQELIDGKPLLK